MDNITQNLGVHIREKEISRFSITQNYNRISLVVGSSKIGVPNLPTIVYSPENFETIYGKQDYSLEKKGSFFHRTVKDLLVEGPVLCLNLRSSDDTKDFYNYYEISTNSTNKNSDMKKSSVRSFYDTAQGFWKRSGSVVNSLNNSDNLLLFTNQKEQDISILIIKSNIQGFDIYAEDYYNGINNVPSYIHPKSYVSDYLVDVICIEGNWSNYDNIKYNKYFDKYGIKANMLQNFLNLSEIKVVKQWTGSLIPYFKDKLNNDFFIESIINDDVNETGILCAFNTEKYETENINTEIDLLGENLYITKNPDINFLSYKRYLTDFIETQDQILDIPGNCFGDLYHNNHGRTTTNTECYIYGITAKNIILSTTGNYIIKPFNYYDNDNAYYILNGKKINIPPDISDVVLLPQILEKETKIVYAIVATLNGIENRVGVKTNIHSAIHYPIVDYTKEFVICNYIFSCDKNNNYNTITENISLTSDGCYDYITNNITFTPTSTNTYSYNFVYLGKYYMQEYIKHLEYIFKSYLKTSSIFLNDLGEKIYPRFINDNHITFDSNDYTVISKLQMYKEDTEFLDGNNLKPVYNYSKYPITFKTNKGILGYQSFITENYMNGNINSGDPFFYMIGEYTIDIIYDSILNKNFLVFDYIVPVLENTKLVLNNSNSNNGLYTSLSFTNYNNRYALEVIDDISIQEKKIKVSIYDGANPYIINIISVPSDNSTHAVVEDWTGDPTIMYEQLNKKDAFSIWNKTVEIVEILSNNSIVINKDRYNDIRIGDMFISNDISGKIFCRVIDIYRYDANNIAITTDLPLELSFNNSEAKRVTPLHKWINSYNFIHIPGYVCRQELLPDGSDTRLMEIMDVLSDLTPYLSNINKFEYRYIVDSYGSGVYMESKKELAILAEKHKFALALINVPSKKDFKSDGTKYTTNNMFDISLLVNGGDKINNYGSSYSPYRSSYSVYLTPYVTVFENNRHIKVPPASHIAQLFMKKHNDENKKINDAVSGLDYIIPTISGLDDIYSVEELNMLEQYGITAITKYLNTTFCFNNRTSLNINSVLRYTHSRDSMIELELSLYKTLTTHQWKNDFEMLKKDVDTVCKYYFENDIIGSYSNDVDTSFIDSQIVVVNTYVEINGKLQTILHRLNILPTGYLG